MYLWVKIRKSEKLFFNKNTGDLNAKFLFKVEVNVHVIDNFANQC